MRVSSFTKTPISNCQSAHVLLPLQRHTYLIVNLFVCHFIYIHTYLTVNMFARYFIYKDTHI